MVKSKGKEMIVLNLTAGNLRLELSPSIGGAISAFEWADESGPRPILRKCNSPLEKVLDADCFPLVPYVNRIRGGCFTFRGRTVRLELAMTAATVRAYPGMKRGLGLSTSCSLTRLEI